MMDVTKYQIGYYNPPKTEYRWVKKDHIEKAPAWCSVDLRDGNQSLVVPMNLEEKLEFFRMLVKIGFKEIEVGFPAASETEYEFLRTLIEKDMIPEDVTVQVLTQCRDHIIRKTFEAVQGAPSAVIHFYNSTSVAQREQVFKKSRDEIKKIATDGAKLVKQLAAEYPGNFRFEYSPESFTGTEPEYALEVCNEVIEIMEPTPEKPMIINLPVTVSMSMSHIYANQIEYMSDNLKHRDSVILSVHPHNDRGCGVADTELAVLAGADRVEGTLFGNGERTGNVDLITLALNLYTHGVDPHLDFSDMPSIVETYERVTRMHVYERTPYAGALVYAAFSGSHQDAIAKGMTWRKEHNLHQWNVPYIPIDPADIGRTYDGDVIRINSQSGKGGIGFLLEQKYGFVLPPKMREHFGYAVKSVSDHAHKELQPEEVLEVFRTTYLNRREPVDVTNLHFVQNGAITATVTVRTEDGSQMEVTAKGNGRLDAVCNAVKIATGWDFTIMTYSEHSMEHGSTSEAASYVGLQWGDGSVTWGAGTDTDIIRAGIKAMISAVNNK
ncbi:MAG TPA: 2-isopropylmalate synthase [Candidatus Lachnoclostridium stercorigallinarum]|uniref:2-isopropylmalate synthase n=1 Tax=Candidatus Lachnoclostridium stercorigallinarum TaxID=2838634 RepID=A0A9D2GI39_9FIRM|nr:2-isopropylmalate synthase [Candidatus Lachnoclostridium stercorigallinarum]